MKVPMRVRIWGQFIAFVFALYLIPISSSAANFSNCAEGLLDASQGKYYGMVWLNRGGLLLLCGLSRDGTASMHRCVCRVQVLS